MTSPASAWQTVSKRVACTQTALLAAITQANASGGGTITFNCRATTIPMTAGLGTIQDGVVLDGEDRGITLEYTTNFTGCSTSDNGLDAPAIGHLRGRHSTVRNLTFKYFLESLQIIGPDNVVEGNVFLGHNCSDDAVSTTTLQAKNASIRNNRFQDYRDKAYQMSFGSGTIEGNTFTNTVQPIRGPYDNSQGGRFVIRSNVFTTTGNREACTGVTIDGTYQLIFERNTMRLLSGSAVERRHAGDRSGQCFRRQPSPGHIDRRFGGRLPVGQHRHQQRPVAGLGTSRWSGRLGKRAGRSWRWHPHHRRTTL